MVRPRKELDVVQTFRGPRILTMEQLCRRLRSSRSTVLRRLREHGYHSSYNHSGMFLTIHEVAEFDSRGLWVWKTARFSKHGNLKETVWHFVEDSEQGMTHGRTRHTSGSENSQFALGTRRRRIGSNESGWAPAFVYLSHKASVRREQVRRRKSDLGEKARSHALPRGKSSRRCLS